MDLTSGVTHVLLSASDKSKPYGVYCQGNCIYFTDVKSHEVRKMDEQGVVEVIAGSQELHGNSMDLSMKQYLANLLKSVWKVAPYLFVTQQRMHWLVL